MATAEGRLAAAAEGAEATAATAAEAPPRDWTGMLAPSPTGPACLPPSPDRGKAGATAAMAAAEGRLEAAAEGLVDWLTGGLVDWWTGGLVDWWTG